MRVIPIVGLCLLSVGCAKKQKQTTQEPDSQRIPADSATPSASLADVVAVSISGEPGAYSFAVTLSTGDTGCGHYADWWEVVDADGTLIYRRILGHSHVDEQPFTRSGGPIAIPEDGVITVRAHMNDTGYGGQVLQGKPTEPNLGATPQADALGADLATEPPLPNGCAF